MPYELFLALRYLRAKRRAGRASARVTAMAGVAGIACGVGSLIFALALSNGFQDEMRDKILRGTAHVTLTRADGKAIEDVQGVIARLRTVPGVVDAAPTTYTGALLSGAEGAAYTVVRGVEQTSARSLGEIRRTLTEGALEPLFAEARENVSHKRDDPGAKRGGATKEVEGIRAAKDVKGARAAKDVEGTRATEDVEDVEAGDALAGALGELADEPAAAVVVGAELAARTGLRRVGDEGWIVTGEQRPESPGLQPRARRVRVAGIFRSGLYEYDSSWLYVSLADAMELEGAGKPGGGASLISIETADIYRTAETSARVDELLGADFKTLDWQEANAPLFAALQLERRTVALIIALIMFVAALNITTTLALVVVERRADIAILGAMGARARSIMLVFICEGAIIGATGACAGVALGLVACFLGDRYHLVSLPADIYSLSAIPFHPRARDVALAALSAFVVSLLATIYPARAAARVRPAETLRYE
ncbi:MAG TPA: ABC transporter permease [Pyrinomonadaceae bacterium]|nr:ABC transporter permease [Pyrinomonadaceae bacterium]